MGRAQHRMADLNGEIVTLMNEANAKDAEIKRLRTKINDLRWELDCLYKLNEQYLAELQDLRRRGGQR